MYVGLNAVGVDQVFCNIPWTEVHINADGTYHTCGAQPNRISGTPGAAIYNVHNMSIDEWINSCHQRKTRLGKLSGVKEPLCNMCYHEEQLGSSSKRIKENLKSQIDSTNFYTSYSVSPDIYYFDESLTHDGLSKMIPYSYHISLGNECNLACRMCTPVASSRIASNMKQIGLYNGPIRMNWTEDPVAWKSVTETICNTKDLKFVHIIGGEPLLNPKFEELIDLLITANKTDIYIGFTTNGTVFIPSLIEKLNVFRHVDIGVSIECTGILNDYIRQGSDTITVLNNIDRYLLSRREGHVYVTVRPVPSALSVHTLDDLYLWCIDRKVDVMTNFLVSPEFMQIKNLPGDVKNKLLAKYKKWEFTEPMPGTSDPRDPNRYKEHIDNEIRAIIKELTATGNTIKTKELYEKLTLWQWFDHQEITKYFETSEIT